MKKILLSSLFISSVMLANNTTVTPKHLEKCVKTDISNYEAIYSCQSGDFFIQYKDAQKTRIDWDSKKSFHKIGDAPGVGKKSNY
ncbi:hypothetical protein [Arcobacter roscoffensis]|uniref:Uncharacterized protein n=1 Tax=Arcobacter roscoffensis TaxID=2961520 RepID=A0ABY5E2W4_9BACT|nr:hypothetical protein [Arcobacter roscoffensis]UTJ05485.1 hypothetical protein NJU99_09430 [Arcobacter roscoffensis]